MTEQVQTTEVNTEEQVQDLGLPKGVPQAKNPPNNQGVPVEKQAPVSTPAAAPTSTTSKPAVTGTEFSTGNAVIDSGLKTLESVTGCTTQDMERAVRAALQTGDESLIDLEYIKEKFKEHAPLAESLAKAYIQDSKREQESTVQAVYQQAGGKEQWDYANSVFQSQAPEYLKNIVNLAVQSGNILEASSVVIEFGKSSGAIPNVGNNLKGSGSPSLGALSASEFKEEYSKLRKEAGNRSLESPQFKEKYNSLLQRREAGRARGW